MGNCRYFCWYYDLLVTGKAIGHSMYGFFPLAGLTITMLFSAVTFWQWNMAEKPTIWFDDFPIDHFSWMILNCHVWSPEDIATKHGHEHNWCSGKKSCPTDEKKVEIVDLPMKNGGSFHSYVTVYQRVTYTYNMFSRWGYKMLTSYN